MQPDVVVDEPVTLSMNPYTGPWTRAEAAHLLRRTLVGPTFAQIQDAVNNGMNATIATLLTPNTIDLPLTYDPGEAVAAHGTTWVNTPYPTGDTAPTDNARRRSLGAWIMKRLNSNDTSISEKMTLFWINHFAVTQQFDARSAYDYFKLLHDNCLGNFKQLVKDVTIHPEMLLFLNGATNTVFSPNENYARELLELFSIGKGPQIGPGDYTYYTEDDVAAGAKILTGWTVNGLRDSVQTDVQSAFQMNLHHQGTKQLSSKFGSVVMSNQGANEYSDYIDIIFQQNQCAVFICTKLYRYFVNYDMTQDVIDNVIPVMVTTMINNNYDVQPVVEQLLKSEHFYDISMRGTIIKSPIESLMTMFTSSMTQPTYDLDTNSEMYLNLFWGTSVMGQNYAAPPSVSGWPAYYQAPSYTKLWVNSTYIKLRFDYAIWLTQYGGININGNAFKVKALNVVDGLSLPNDAVSVINDLCDLYFSKAISQTEKDNLKSILTNGLPDFEWTIQYNDYQNNPGDPSYSDPVRIRVELVLTAMFRMAQYQTI
ncbi:MAG: DUF1800 domain-containing protein [Crocinitomicaceae bacterium]|jgi:uncharacterized protein (DUF1800 family)|nr:DUF1800 domain-containing protein [Crocinitomicaceae bacterium]